MLNSLGSAKARKISSFKLYCIQKNRDYLQDFINYSLDIFERNNKVEILDIDDSTTKVENTLIHGKKRVKINLLVDLDNI